MKINLNHIVKVKLTDLGNKIYEDYIRSQYESISDYIGVSQISLKKIEDQDGYIHFPLWEFMSIFGEHFYVGSEAVTEDNAIIAPDDTITIELQEQLRKARKKAKRWKRKYLELRYRDVAKTNEEEPKVCETKSVLTGNRKLDSIISDAIDEEDFCILVSDKYTRSLYNYVRKNYDKLKSIGYELDAFIEFEYITIIWDNDLAGRFMNEYKTERKDKA